MELNIGELINILNDYISKEYDYDYADVFEHSICIHTHDGKLLWLEINVDEFIDKEVKK